VCTAITLSVSRGCERCSETLLLRVSELPHFPLQVRTLSGRLKQFPRGVRSTTRRQMSRTTYSNSLDQFFLMNARRCRANRRLSHIYFRNDYEEYVLIGSVRNAIFDIFVLTANKVLQLQRLRGGMADNNVDMASSLYSRDTTCTAVSLRLDKCWTETKKNATYSFGQRKRGAYSY
jgi:hypothetical protein